jgi:hypothetical protein
MTNGFEIILPFLKPIEHLVLDDTISEIMINGADRVFIERGGFLEQIHGVSLGGQIPDGCGQEHRSTPRRRYF